MDIWVESDDDVLRDLRADLLTDSLWRGRVELVERPAEPGTLGPVLDAARIVLDPATLTPLVTALVAYLRYRTTDVNLKIRRSGETTEVTLSGKRIKRLDNAALTAELASFVARLEQAQDDERR